MHTEMRAQNMESGGVVTYYNYLGKATLKFGTGLVRKNPNNKNRHCRLSFGVL